MTSSRIRRDLGLLYIGGPAVLGLLGFTLCATSCGSTDNGVEHHGADDNTSAAAGSDSNPTGGSGGDDTVMMGVGGTSAQGGGSSGAGGSAANVGGGAGKGASDGGSATVGSAAGKIAAGVRWVGRVETTDMAHPKFGWGGSGFVAQFSGTGASVTLNNTSTTGGIFFQAVVDGTVGMRFKASDGMSTTAVATGLTDGTHTIGIYRETESWPGISQLMAVTASGGAAPKLLPPPTYSGRILEVVGDSAANGYGELGQVGHAGGGVQNECMYTIDTQSNYKVFGSVTARALNADWSIVANSGWGLAKDNQGGAALLMPNAYGMAFYQYGGAMPTWDFSVKAQASVVVLGGNDLAKWTPDQTFADALDKLIDTIRAKNGPDTWVFAGASPMVTTGRDIITGFMKAVVTKRNGDAGKVAYVELGTLNLAVDGSGCGWHPNVKQHQDVADKLIPVVKQKLGW